MNIITIGLIAGAGYLLLNSNKSKASSSPVVLPKGFEVSADCKNFIVKDYDAAMKWAFNEGKKVTSDNIDEKLANAMGSMIGDCDPKQFANTKNNHLFSYDLQNKWFEGYLSKHPSKVYDVFIGLGIARLYAMAIFKKLGLKIEDSEIKKPLDLPIVKKLVCSIRGFTLKDCKFIVTNESQMMKFVYETSKIFGKVAIDQDNTFGNEFKILGLIILDFETNCKEELPLKIQYLMMYNFIKAMVDIKQMDKEEANKFLANEFNDFGKVINEYNLPKEI